MTTLIGLEFVLTLSCEDRRTSWRRFFMRVHYVSE